MLESIKAKLQNPQVKEALINAAVNIAVTVVIGVAINVASTAILNAVNAAQQPEVELNDVVIAAE